MSKDDLKKGPLPKKKFRLRKLLLAAAVAVLAVFFLLPPAAGWALRGTVAKKATAALGSPVKIGALRLRPWPLGADLDDVTVGESEARTAGNPPLRIARLTVSLPWSALAHGPNNITATTLDGVELNVGCDKRGRSNLRELLDRIPPSDRKEPLRLGRLEVRNVRARFYVPGRRRRKDVAEVPAAVSAPAVEAFLDELTLTELLLPAPGKLPPEAVETNLVVAGLNFPAPLVSSRAVGGSGESGEGKGGESFPGSPGGVKLERLELGFTAPAATGVPLRLRGVIVRGLEVVERLGRADRPTALQRAARVVGAALGAAAVSNVAPPEKTETAAAQAASAETVPAGAGGAAGAGGILLEKLKAEKLLLEIHGRNASGQSRLLRWRDGRIEAERLALAGAEVSPDAPGFLKVMGPLEVSPAAGKFPGLRCLTISVNKLSGAGPKSSFMLNFILSGVDDAVFSPHIERVAGAGVEQGTLSFTLAGPVVRGRLRLAGTVAFSHDFKLVPAGRHTSPLSFLIGGAAVKSLGQVAAGKRESFFVAGTLDKPKLNFSPLLQQLLGPLVHDFQERLKKWKAGGSTGFFNLLPPDARKEIGLSVPTAPTTLPAALAPEKLRESVPREIKTRTKEVEKKAGEALKKAENLFEKFNPFGKKETGKKADGK